MQLKCKYLFERMSFHIQALNIEYMKRKPANLQKYPCMRDHKLQQSPSLHSCVRKCRNCSKPGYSYVKTTQDTISISEEREEKKNQECAKCDGQNLVPLHQEAMRYEPGKICFNLRDIMPTLNNPSCETFYIKQTVLHDTNQLITYAPTWAKVLLCIICSPGRCKGTNLTHCYSEPTPLLSGL